MANVKYKKPPESMKRMVIKPETTDRPSLGMTEVKGEIYYLSPDNIIPYKNQARKNIKEESLLELATSIMNQGIIQPLQIIQSSENNGKFEVVSGERRLRAALKIGLDKVPCMILARDRDSDEISLIENIQREDLHPIELADAVAKLLNGKKYGGQVEMAGRIGVSKQQISHLSAISRLPEDIKKHLLQKTNLKINDLKKIAYLKDEISIREKVFQSSDNQEKYKPILRISYNGKFFKFDHLNINKLSGEEKELLLAEIISFAKKLSN